MGLSSHLHGLHGDDVENRAVCGEQQVKFGSQIGFLYLVGREICDIEPTMISECSLVPVFLTYVWFGATVATLAGSDAFGARPRGGATAAIVKCDEEKCKMI